jgi:hypothetical protein
MDPDRSRGKPRVVSRSVDVEIAGWSTSINRVRQTLSPRIRYPLMFRGMHLGLTLFRGWNPILLSACTAIEQVTRCGGLAFHWVYLNESEGTGHFLYSLGEQYRYVVDAADQSRRATLAVTHVDATTATEAIDQIVAEAELMSSRACLVCGARAAKGDHFGRVLPLCLTHHPDLLNGAGEEGLQGVWRRSVEWEELIPR